MWVVVLGSHLPYHSSACWVFTDHGSAVEFAEFVTTEIDPAEVIEARNPVGELLTWRAQMAATDTTSPGEKS